MLPEVFYLWCSADEHNSKPSNWFEFNNFMAVSSALQTVKPDKVGGEGRD